jgi:hypothetical protein
MVFGVGEFHGLYSIEAYYGGRRRKVVGFWMHDSTNYCDSLRVSTPYSTRSGAFSSDRYVYSPNYAVPTLGIYREEYYLIEMSIPRNSWLANNFSHGEIEFGLNGYIAPEYKASIRIRADIFVIQARNYNNRSILPMSISLLF